MVADVAERIHAMRERGESLLFEGAQGALLDIDHGTYPFVTSSNCLAGAAAPGSGIGPQLLDYVLGIVKAYTTRVGGGPFPTELTDDVGAGLAKRGNEFGSVTGRPRRCGWLDLPAAAPLVQLNGVDGACITKLDVLDGMPEIRICTRYRDRRQARRPHSRPARKPSRDASRCTRRCPAGARAPSACAAFDALPANARAYLRRIEALTGVPIAMVSTGPGPRRNDRACRSSVPGLSANASNAKVERAAHEPPRQLGPVQHAGRAPGAKVHESGFEFNQIICIARGGLRVGDVLSRIYEQPLAILSTHSYTAEGGTVRGELVIAEHMTMTAPRLGDRVLLVDDMVDSGHTLEEVVKDAAATLPAHHGAEDRGAVVEGVLGVQARLPRRVPAPTIRGSTSRSRSTTTCAPRDSRRGCRRRRLPLLRRAPGRLASGRALGRLAAGAALGDLLRALFTADFAFAAPRLTAFLAAAVLRPTAVLAAPALRLAAVDLAPTALFTLRTAFAASLAAASALRFSVALVARAFLAIAVVALPAPRLVSSMAVSAFFAIDAPISCAFSLAASTASPSLVSTLFSSLIATSPVRSRLGASIPTNRAFRSLPTCATVRGMPLAPA